MRPPLRRGPLAFYPLRFSYGAYILCRVPDEEQAMDDEQERELDALDTELLAEWRGGAPLSTLDLRSAQHAAEREGADSDARKIAGLISTREAKGDTR